MAYMKERREMRKERREERHEMREEGRKMGKGMRDESMFGFPSNCMVEEYPKEMRYNDMSGADRWDVAGQDYEIDSNVSGLNRNKSRMRF